MTKKSRSDCRDAMGEDDIGCERNQFRCIALNALGVARRNGPSTRADHTPCVSLA